MFKIITGFIILFSLYHGAEYMIMKENSARGFLALQAVFFLWRGCWPAGKGLRGIVPGAWYSKQMH